MTIIRILTPADYQLSNWSGGKTRQLYLFPENGQYAEQTFEYRLSTATVEQNTSTFTALPAYHRILMSLNQPITLINSDRQQNIHLAPFTPYAFEGSAHITNHGKCTDFNVMYNDCYQAQTIPVHAAQPFLHQEADTQFLYALQDLNIEIAGQLLGLKKEELLLAEKEEQEIDIKMICSSQQSESTPIAVWTGLNKK